MNGLMLPQWPKDLPRVFKPIAKLEHDPKIHSYDLLDMLALNTAKKLRDRDQQLRCSALTGTLSEMIFANKADFSAFNTSASEGSLLAGTNEQPVLPALFFDGNRAYGRVVTFLARGVLGSTGTPTITFQTRLGTSSGSASLSGTSCGVSAAITTASSITNKFWELRLDLTCYTPGIGSGNTTLSGAGYVSSPGGFASPYIYALEPSTPDTATWTITIDNSVTQYFNLSVTWSASSSSNTITCKQLFCGGPN